MKILRCKTLVILGFVFIMLLSPIYKTYTVGDVQVCEKKQTVNHQSYDNLDKMRYENFSKTSEIQNIIAKENKKQIEIQSMLIAYSGLSRGGESREEVKYKIIEKISQRDGEFNEYKSLSEKENLANTIIAESLALGVNPLTIASMIDVESKFRTDAKSSFGATGLMQIMPSMAKSIAEEMGITEYDLTNYKDNIKMGTYYYVVNCVGAWSHNNITQYNPKTGKLLSAYEMGLMTYNGNTKTAKNLSNIEYMYLVEDALSKF